MPPVGRGQARVTCAMGSDSWVGGLPPLCQRRLKVQSRKPEAFLKTVSQHRDAVLKPSEPCSSLPERAEWAWGWPMSLTRKPLLAAPGPASLSQWAQWVGRPGLTAARPVAAWVGPPARRRRLPGPGWPPGWARRPGWPRHLPPLLPGRMTLALEKPAVWKTHSSDRRP